MASSQYHGISMMAKRLDWRGGFPQQDRMIKDKKWTLDHAVKYSYQAAKIRHTDSENLTEAPSLINPDKTKQNYDDKIVSVGYEYGFKPGDVFDWLNTGTKWIIYLQDLTELAYFRGEIRRCNYQVSWKGKDGTIYTQHLAVRGPVETKINFIQKNGISVDEPNHSLDILMTKTPEALQYFQRYAKFYLKGIERADKKICWRVEAVDTISMPGIIQVVAVEYYANNTKDDIVDGVANGLVLDPVDPNEEDGINDIIEGPTFIKPRVEYSYFYRKRQESARWSLVTKNSPAEIVKIDDHKMIVRWNSSYHGQFEIACNGYKKTIVVESLF